MLKLYVMGYRRYRLVNGGIVHRQHKRRRITLRDGTQETYRSSLGAQGHSATTCPAAGSTSSQAAYTWFGRQTLLGNGWYDVHAAAAVIPARLQDFQRLELPVSETVSGRIGYPHEAFMCFDYRVAASRCRPATPSCSSARAGAARRSRRWLTTPAASCSSPCPGDAPFRPAYLPDGARLPANVVAAYATATSSTTSA